MIAARRGSDVQYLVLGDPSDPFFLARVRWPDVFDAISPARPTWLPDVGLFDLPYDPASTAISRAEATRLAASWGATLPGPEEPSDATGLTMIRRMPANWSNLSPAEMRPWALDIVRAEQRRAQRPRWFRRRRGVTAPAPVLDLRSGTARTIDLTDAATARATEEQSA